MRAPIPMLLLAAPALAESPVIDARGTVQFYYHSIEQGDFRVAYSIWGDRGRRSGQSYAAFVRGFAETAHTRVVAGQPGRQEGAAGSVYVTVPVEVFATLKDGRRQRFRGAYVLRRINAELGGAQQGWRIDSARLRVVR